MSVFAYCRELKIVDLPSTVRFIDGSAFARCENLESVTLNNNITTIGSSAFSGCSKLTLTTLPTSLVTLGGSAFQSAGAGINITSLPDGISVIPTWTFNGCPNVKISEFGGGSSKLKEIGSNSFNTAGKGDTGPALNKITINSSITTIGEGAFIDYGNINAVTIYGTTDKFDINAIGLGGVENIEYKNSDIE